jgi:hypothetical protein
MSKKVTLFVLLALTVPFFVNAQNAQKSINKMASKQLFLDPATKEMPTPLPKTSGFYKAPKEGNWVLVDSSANAYGGASWMISPLAYEPYAGVLTMVHRAASSTGGSGAIVYNYSTDKGVTWKRVSPAINGTISALGRYPSGAIANSTHGDISQTMAIFAWPQLLAGGSGFGNLGYGADAPVGGGQCFAVEELGSYSSSNPIWASDKTPYVFWIARSNVSEDNRIFLFRTSDYIKIDNIVPAGWDDTLYRSGWGGYELSGYSRNGIQYMGFITKPTDRTGLTLDPSDTVNYYFPMFSKSTDDGATWSPLKAGDIYGVKAFQDKNLIDFYDDIKYDTRTVSFEGCFTVDKNDRIHFFTVLTDTTGFMDGTLPYNNKLNALVEFYQKDDNNWDGKIVYAGIPDSAGYTIGPGLGQMRVNPKVAITKEGDAMVAQWCMPVPGSSTPWCDIYQSYRSLNGEWSNPVNISNSPLINNTQNHLAPALASDGNKITAFSYYGYQKGATGPYADSGAVTNIWVSSNTYTLTGVKEDASVVNTFELSQNYPNPFNPATVIKYSVPAESKVTLKVYDVLGKQVATLVNDVKAAGSYSVNFDASKLASGMYIYSITAGNYSSSKKMMLLK